MDWDEIRKSSTPMRHDTVAPYLPPLRPRRRSGAAGRSLDLHGLTLQGAHSAVLAFLEAHYGHEKKITIITGRSGEIFCEFPRWMELDTRVRAIEMLANGGSFLVHLVKRK